MTKKLITRNILLGLLSWAIPFAISFFLYTPNGQPVVSPPLFKSIMIATGSLTGCILLYRYFKFVDSHYIANGIIVGLSWLAINIIMDALVLIPLMKVSFAYYFTSIGLGYVVIPVISITMGSILNKKSTTIVHA